jgi:hypothetical protein
MNISDMQRRFDELREQPATTVNRLEMGMLGAAIATMVKGRPMMWKDMVMNWPGPGDSDDARLNR